MFMCELIDYKEAASVFNSSIGFASIAFRTSEDPSYAINQNNFNLNTTGDGWFRKDKYAGPASGYGLCINSIKITNRKKTYHAGEPTWVGQEVGNFIAYKAIINYTNNNFDPEVEEDKFWVFVHKQFDIHDVIEYIVNHRDEWKP
jgi:hypothetical protein